MHARYEKHDGALIREAQAWWQEAVSDVHVHADADADAGADAGADVRHASFDD